MNKISWYFLLIIVFLGTACGPAVRPASSFSTDKVVVFQREGGYAGITQEWVIFANGTIEAPGEKSLTAEPDDADELLSLTRNQEILTMKDSYVPKNNCCDKFVYTVTIMVGDEEKTIRTSDDVQQPEELTELLDVIQQLITNAEETSG